MSIRFNIKGYVDRRGPRELAAAAYLEQARADADLEQRWRDRVAQHPVERARLLQRRQAQAIPMLLRRQA